MRHLSHFQRSPNLHTTLGIIYVTRLYLMGVLGNIMYHYGIISVVKNVGRSSNVTVVVQCKEVTQ